MNTLLPKRGLSILALLLSLCPLSFLQASSKIKNVVVIVADDLTSSVLGSYGNERVSTPALDKLASGGTRFSNAYANSPMCAPSRASMLTGKYPHRTGFNLLFTPFAYKGKQSIAEHLRAAGFATAIIGKNHWNHWIWQDLWETRPDHGFDLIVEGHHYAEHNKKIQAGSRIPSDLRTYDRTKASQDRIHVWNPDYLPHPYTTEDSEAAFYVDQSVEFLEANKDKQSFLWLAFKEPHAPFAFPVEFANRFDPSTIELPQGSAEDDRWIPEIFARFTDEQRRNAIASYWTCVEFLDSQISRFIQTLDTRGLLDETLIIFTSDHGYLLDEHKRFEKHEMWEAAIKTPLILNGPGIPAASNEALTELVDLAPTILDYLDLPPMDTIDGRSLKPLVSGETDQHRHQVFAEFLEDNKAMIADSKFKYVFTTGKRDLGQGYATGQGASGLYHRLYNLEKDPTESTNLARHPEYKEVVVRYQEKLLEQYKSSHPNADQIPDGLTPLGQLVWFLEPRDVGAEHGGTPLRVFED
ncbi:sulfatase family protein [Pelagicoccus mobilis]|uniref:Sulfatase-like hydrolase/transferase n=1 Tax=Pelagicoccus mobilis TaxID=415221 RepID=A0A934VU79_9BACT|nr:sulfatase-like hydrolase/transferase [Pelagicoccus mobilis]MBK1880478.1 sulfatase-like hydrolase/transferase [Pelagicoccus mobilis]